MSQRIRYTRGWSGENRRITTDDHRATSRADDAVSLPCHTLRTVVQCNSATMDPLTFVGPAERTSIEPEPSSFADPNAV